MHKRDIVVAMLAPRAREAVTWKLANEPRAVRRLAKKLDRETAGGVRCAYEAGPCGYVVLHPRPMSRLGSGRSISEPPPTRRH